MVWVKMWVNRLTHTLTHTRIGLKSTGEEAFAFSPVFLVLFCSHDLRHEAAHRLCGLVLLLPCGVGVLVVKVDHHRIEKLRVTQRPHAGEKVETALIGEMAHE